MMAKIQSDQRLKMHKSYGDLLHELKIIWDEVGETNDERDKVLAEIEQECLEIYKGKVCQADCYRDQIKDAIVQTKQEIAAINTALAEPSIQWSQQSGSLKDELKLVKSHLLEMQEKKRQRMNQFLEVMEKMQELMTEIDPTNSTILASSIDASNLSIEKLEEYNRYLQQLQEEKVNRRKKIADLLKTMTLLSQVLGMDLEQILAEISTSSIDQKDVRESISDSSIANLSLAILKLQETKRERMDKLQDLATSMLELWNLMDTPSEEQQKFQNVTCNIAASEDEITEPNALSEDFIHHVEEEVIRLQECKASRMKELVAKKKAELEELCRRAHISLKTDCKSLSINYIPDDDDDAIDDADDPYLLEQLEIHISIVKEEAFSRRDLLEKVEKWLATCEEESWLEDYNRAENRYNAGRGTHLALKRAEKARALVTKIPGKVEALIGMITTWEKERGIEFNYDGVRFISLLEDYTATRQEKEQERRRHREEKRVHGTQITTAATEQQETSAVTGGAKSQWKNVQKNISRTFPSRYKKSTSSAGGTDHLLQSTPKSSPKCTTIKSSEESA